MYHDEVSLLLVAYQVIVYVGIHHHIPEKGMVDASAYQAI